MKLRFRFFYQQLGTHTHVRLFAAPAHNGTVGTYALVGVLRYRNDEWAAFREDAVRTSFEFVKEEV